MHTIHFEYSRSWIHRQSLNRVCLCVGKCQWVWPHIVFTNTHTHTLGPPRHQLAGLKLHWQEGGGVCGENFSPVKVSNEKIQFDWARAHCDPNLDIVLRIIESVFAIIQIRPSILVIKMSSSLNDQVQKYPQSFVLYWNIRTVICPKLFISEDQVFRLVAFWVSF